MTGPFRLVRARRAAGSDGAGGPVVFGSFNNLQKISGDTFDLWAAVLAAATRDAMARAAPLRKRRAAPSGNGAWLR